MPELRRCLGKFDFSYHMLFEHSQSKFKVEKQTRILYLRLESDVSMYLDRGISE